MVSPIVLMLAMLTGGALLVAGAYARLWFTAYRGPHHPWMVGFCLACALACALRIAQMTSIDPTQARWLGCAFGSVSFMVSVQWVSVIRIMGGQPVPTPGFLAATVMQVGLAIGVWIPGFLFDPIALRRTDAAGFEFWGSTPAPFAPLIFVGGLLMSLMTIHVAWSYPRERRAERRILIVSTVLAGLMMQTSYISSAVAPWIPPVGVLAIPLLLMPAAFVLTEQIDSMARHLEARVRARTHALNERNAELERALAQAEAARESQARFLANVSHELRTPLTGVLGMLDLVRRDPNAGDAPELLGVARRSGAELLSLINELLDAARIEAEMVVLEPRDIVVSGLVRDLLRAHEPAAQLKGLQLQQRVEPAVPHAIVADPQRLRQILHNLLGNAVKFTSEGSVTLVVRASDAEIDFEVQDTGPGLGDTTPERLFARFTQADDSTTRLYGGTGLGLSIARDLALLMGGDLVATQRTEGGASFLLRVPRVDSEDTSDAPTPVSNTERPAFAGAVLLVDDDPTNRMVISRLLLAYGIEIRTTTNGEEALASIERSAPDLVLMDCYMPVLDGFDATRKLRERGLTVPIVALTASAGSADRAASLKAGMDDHLSKPIVLSELEVVLERFLPRR